MSLKIRQCINWKFLLVFVLLKIHNVTLFIKQWIFTTVQTLICSTRRSTTTFYSRYEKLLKRAICVLNLSECYYKLVTYFSYGVLLSLKSTPRIIIAFENSRNTHDLLQEIHNNFSIFWTLQHKTKKKWLKSTNSILIYKTIRIKWNKRK